MTREDVLEFFSERQKHWQVRDADALALGHAPNGLVLSPMLGRREGRDAIRDSYRALFSIFPDWVFVSETPVIDGDRVALPFSTSATHVGEFMGLAGTNRRFQVHGVMLIEMAGDLIQTERRTYDFTGLLMQVGVLRGKPAKD